METILGVYCKDYPDMAYLYKEDLDTVDKVNDKVKQLGQLFFTSAGVDFVKTHFSVEELNKLAKDNGFIGSDYFLRYLSRYSEDDFSKILIWNKEDVLKNLSGVPSMKLPDGFHIIFFGEKLPFTATDFMHYLKLIKENYDEKAFNIDLFNSIWDDDFDNDDDIISGVKKFFDFDPYSTSSLDYNHVDIYFRLIDYDKPVIERVELAQKELNTYLEELGKPLYERTLPPFAMRNIVRNLQLVSPVTEENKKTYIVFLDKLASMHDKKGLELKAYAYYGGNAYVKEDYKISEQCLLELMKDGFDDDYADTLGYIYYYGRVNNGVPQYDKAFEYFMMSSIAGNVEATYKLGDMYKNGYGVVQNVEAARRCYENLYPKVLREFYWKPEYSSLADVALRLGSFYTDSENAHIGARLFLEALLSIEIRKGKFDSSVKHSILRCLFDVYEKEKDAILSHNNIKYSFFHVFEFEVERTENRLLIDTEHDEIIFDLEQMNCMNTSSFEIQFEGEVLQESKEKSKCDEVSIYNDEIHFRFKSEDVLVIKNGKTKIIFPNQLVETVPDENIYHVAICQYSKGQGRKYTFLVEEDGSVDDEWVIKENDTVIYPVEIKDQKGYELPCDASVLKHIVRKK